MAIRKRLTRSGYKKRRTYRINKVKKSVSELNIGARDKENLISLLTKDVQTKKGFNRSKKLESVILSKDSKGIKRFKEFKGLKNGSIESVLRQLKSDSDFYNKNRELISEYNELTEDERKNKRNRTTINLDNELIKYNRSKQKQYG